MEKKRYTSYLYYIRSLSQIWYLRKRNERKVNCKRDKNWITTKKSVKMVLNLSRSAIRACKTKIKRD